MQSRTLKLALLLTALAALAVAAPGCGAIGGIFGNVGRSIEETSTKEVAPKYDGLRGKTFAVVVAADRIIQADFPSVVGDLTLTISERLADHDKKLGVGAEGYVPGQKVLEFQYNTPRWIAMSPEELAAKLKVQRLIFIDLQEFRLNDPGNQYLWSGAAAGTVRVVEADTKGGSISVMQEPIRVKFPDQDNLGPAQVPANTVKLALEKRFSDRAAWLFYKHEEPMLPKY